MTARVRLVHSAALILAGTCLTAGCAASDRQRPIETSRIATSGDTLQAARKQLEGRWTLISLEYAAPDGKRASVEGTAGSIVADAFGNLEIEYRLSDSGRKTLNPDHHVPLVKNFPDAEAVQLSAEHCKLQLGPKSRDLKIGDKVELVVGYADFTTVLHDEFHGFRGDRLEVVWPILGRGKIQ